MLAGFVALYFIHTGNSRTNQPVSGRGHRNPEPGHPWLQRDEVASWLDSKMVLVISKSRKDDLETASG